MTLVIAIAARETIWLAADRRLSAGRRVITDTARKLVALETTDGTAMLGYAGLGRTAGGTEPSDWMGRVLRGRNWPLEQALGAIADALQAEMPRHMGRGAVSHHIIVPAFVGKRSRLYSIELALSGHGRPPHFRYTRWTRGAFAPLLNVSPRTGLAGSGAAYLSAHDDWQRELLRLIKGHDRGRVPARAVADRLAALNHRVHSHDATVGPKCIVAWRHRRGSPHREGGGSQYYAGIDRVSPSIKEAAHFPTIVQGMDLGAITSLMMPGVRRAFEEMESGVPIRDMGDEEFQADFQRLPKGPDDKLR